MEKYENYTPEIQYGEELPVRSGTTTEPAPVVSRRSRGKKQRQQKSEEKPKPEAKKRQTNQTPEESVWMRIKTALTGTSARVLAGIFFGCITIYLLVSFVSYFVTCIQDQSVINSTPIGMAGKVGNAGGEGGARLSEFLINECFGLGSMVIIVWLGAISLKLLAGRPRFRTLDFTIKCFVALITVSLIVGLSTIGLHSSVNWGGYHGRYVNEFIVNFIGWTGAWLLCFFLVALFVVICLRDLVKWIMRKKRAFEERRREQARIKAEQEAREEEIRRMQEQEKIDDIRAGEAAIIEAAGMTDVPDNSMSFGGDDAPLYTYDGIEGDNGVVTTETTETPADVISEPTDDNKTEEEAAPDPDEVAESQDTAQPAADDTMVVNINEIGKSENTRFKSEVDMYESHKYKFPPYDLLRPGVEKINADLEEQNENKELIRKTLLEFGIPIVSIEATVGPTVTLYEIVPEKGVKIARIRNLADDITLRLAASGVRIIAPIPGRGSVGIEVPNKVKQTVSMRTVIQSPKYQETKYHLPIALGSTISNEVYIADLAKMPHLLVAGATGQGKSVGLNAIIASLLYCKKPYELKFVMIDPKQVEFSLYNKIKNHYLAMIPDGEDEHGEVVITKMDRVEETLNSLCIEMDDRYSLLRDAMVRNIEEYNTKIKNGLLNPTEGHRFLPYIVVVVDEFADLIMTSGKNVEKPIARLAQKARAVGMHVILATQRPSVNVITGLIKANFPARISFKVMSGTDSKIILDGPGAQYLIGMGDMLVFQGMDTTRVQCAFIDTPEVQAVCDYIERQPYPMGPYILPEPKIEGADGQGAGGSASLSDRDPLFEEIARVVVKSNTASTSSIQRAYQIGYNRAGRIMDQLEAAGVVGPSHGAKPRQVLVDAMSLEELLSTLK